MRQKEIQRKLSIETKRRQLDDKVEHTQMLKSKMGLLKKEQTDLKRTDRKKTVERI